MIKMLNTINVQEVYAEWIKTLRFEDNGGNWVKIQTPFTDYFGDVIYLFLEQIGNKIHLTDFGATISGLEMLNIDFKRKSTYPLFQKLLNNQDCICSGNDSRIYIEFLAGDAKDLIKHINKLIQAMISVNAFFLSNENCK